METDDDNGDDHKKGSRISYFRQDMIYDVGERGGELLFHLLLLPKGQSTENLVKVLNC